MKRVIHVVDYGIGNLLSVARAIEKVGGEARLTHDPAEIAAADRVLLPGVGAFAACMRTLNERDLSAPIVNYALSDRPFLGICVGMQMLFDYGLEFGRHAGLGLVPGHVAPIPAADAAGTRKVPHIGWSAFRIPVGRDSWSETLLDGLADGKSTAYFLHSYACLPDNPCDRLADVDYNGFLACAAIQRGNIFGFQCHPEKSASIGLEIITRFIDL